MAQAENLTTLAAQIEALAAEINASPTSQHGWNMVDLVLAHSPAIVTALRQAEAAPIAWRYEYRDSKQKPWHHRYSDTEVRVQHANCEYVRNPQPLYAAPLDIPQAEAAPATDAVQS